MAKVTSKLQLTIPKVIADQYSIRPGDELDWTASGDAIRVSLAGPRRRQKPGRTIQERLTLFDRTTERLRERSEIPDEVMEPPERPWKPHEIERGWRREDLYDRGRSH